MLDGEISTTVMTCAPDPASGRSAQASQQGSAMAFPAMDGGIPTQYTKTLDDENRGKHFYFESSNVTSMLSHAAGVAERGADAFALQEHSCPPSDLAKVSKALAETKHKWFCGPLVPDVRHNLGGVGLVAPRMRKNTIVKPRTEAFTQAVQTGRVQAYALDIGAHTVIFCYNVYGYTGGHENTRQAKKTALLFEACSKRYAAR